MDEHKLDGLKGDKKIPKSILYKRMLVYVKPAIFKFLLALLLIVINVGIDIVFPLFISSITNNLNSPNRSLSIILAFAIGYTILAILSGIFAYFEAMILQKAGQKIIYNLRMEVFTHIENMSQPYITPIQYNILHLL